MTETTVRDYLAEMDARIYEATQGSDWVAAIVAQELFDDLLQNDTELLDEWLRLRGPDILREAITKRVRVDNATRRRSARAHQFRDRAQELEDAEDDESRGVAIDQLSVFFETLTVDEKNTRKQACDMTGSEHLFVAEHRYRNPAKRLVMLASFHEAVAKKVGDRHTSEVFTEDEYIAMYRSITGE